MADEYHQIGAGNSGNWWDSSSRNNNSNNNRGSSSSPSSSALTSMGSFGWPTEIVDLKPTSNSIDNNSSLSHNSILFQDAAVTHKQLQVAADSSASAGTPSAASVLADPNLQIMGLGLSNSPTMDWNQTLLHGEKAETSFRSVLQEDLNLNTNFQQENWREKMYSATSEDSSVGNEYKQILQMDHAASYGGSSTMFQGLLESPQPGGYENRAVNYPFPPPPGYAMNAASELSQPPPAWSKFPQFRGSPPKQQPHSHLQFSNNAPFWNATAASISDGRSGFFPSSQPQFSHIIEEKPKSLPEVREMAATAKKASGDSSNKRQRSDAPSPLPAFKVRKEKMGDRITALQQLVSPFGKTDTASVLSEAIEYIKFLHEQVNVLSTPYMKSGAAMHQQQQQQQHHHQQSSSKTKDPEGPGQDLRSRGLCLVPISSTFPVTHETTVDFWTPTFGGTFR